MWKHKIDIGRPTVTICMINDWLTRRGSAGGVEGFLVMVGGGGEADGRSIEAPSGRTTTQGTGAEVGRVGRRGAVAPVVRVVESKLTHIYNTHNNYKYLCTQFRVIFWNGYNLYTILRG